MKVKTFILLAVLLTVLPSACFSADVVVSFYSSESTNIIHLESDRYTINELCTSNEHPEELKSCIVRDILPENLNVSVTAISNDSVVSDQSNVLSISLSEFRTRALHTLICSKPSVVDALLVLNASVGLGVKELCQ